MEQSKIIDTLETYQQASVRSPSSPHSVRSGDGARPATGFEAAYEGLREWQHVGRRRLSRPHVMYLRRGWKTFARAHSRSEGLVPHFKLM